MTEEQAKYSATTAPPKDKELSRSGGATEFGFELLSICSYWLRSPLPPIS